MQFRLLLILSCLLIAGLAAAQGPPGGKMPPPEVSFITATPGSIPANFDFVGVAQASRLIEVRARVQGFIETRLFEEGAFVNEGDLLYRIDKRSFEADLKVAEARVEQSRSSVDLTERELKRLQSLRESGAVAQSDFDRAQSQYDTARASLRLAEAELDKSRLELSYTDIHAPISGYVWKAMKDTGSLVDDGSNSYLTQITRLSPIYVSVNVSERDYLSWKVQIARGEITLREGEQQRFQLILQDGSTFPEEGKLTFEDAGFRPETGTYEMRAEFPNKESLLKPGQFVNVRILGWERANTILVPQRSVNQLPSGAFVYVIDGENKVELRSVQLGAWIGSDWIIRSGVKAGDRVLVDGFMKVGPGVVVSPVPHVRADKEVIAETPKAKETAKK